MPTITVSIQVPDGAECTGCTRAMLTQNGYVCGIYDQSNEPPHALSGMFKNHQCFDACQAAEKPALSTGKIIKNLFLELNRLREITGVSERRDEG